jgi:hypothetical protein
MVARKAEYLQTITVEPPGYREALQAWAAKHRGRVEPYWTPLNPKAQFLWTDNYYTLWPVLSRAGDED